MTLKSIHQALAAIASEAAKTKSALDVIAFANTASGELLAIHVGEPICDIGGNQVRDDALRSPGGLNEKPAEPMDCTNVPPSFGIPPLAHVP